MKTMFVLAVAALPLLAAAQNQTIWRCGPDGSSYSATPCSDGRALEAQRSRPDADVQAARRSAVREQHLADQMRKQRLRAEGQPRALAGFRTTPPGAGTNASTTKPRKQRPPEAAGTWRATAPVSRRTKG